MNNADLQSMEKYVAARVVDGLLLQGGSAGSDEEQRLLVEELARAAIDEASSQMFQQGLSAPTAEEERTVFIHVLATQIGLGRLQLLLDDDTIENIDINGCDVVWVKRADGTKEMVTPIADSDTELIELIQRAARGHHTGGERRIDGSKPIVDINLAGGHRLSAIIEVATRPCVSIRRHRLPDPTLEDLRDSMSPELLFFLRAAVRAKLNMIVSGGTDAGKTTMLRALLAEADPKERIITIELSYELGLHELAYRHPDCPAWETREANTEGEGEITMDALVRRANRHNADRVVVGEVLGDEIVPMLNAMTAGKSGSMCTIHADSTEATFGKIQMYASQSPKRLTESATAQLIAQALDLVVYVTQRKSVDGSDRRYISSVRAVEDSDGPHVISTEIFAEPKGGGPAVSYLTIPLKMQAKLASVGYEAPVGTFIDR